MDPLRDVRIREKLAQEISAGGNTQQGIIIDAEIVDPPPSK